MNAPSAIVTGAYGAIGKAIAHGMAEKGFRLTLAGRDAKKLESLAAELIRLTGNTDITSQRVDLSRKSEIILFAQQWQGPLDVLINNAAATPPNREETPEGIEMQFATNVLGYYWMMQYFHPHMVGRGDARIVNVASYWAGDMDLDDLQFTRRRYNNDTAYRQTKQANRMLTASFAELFAPLNIAVLAVHPGDVNSKLSNNLGYGGSESPKQGADTPLFCATDPSLRGVSGKYFEHRLQVNCPFVDDKAAVRRLHEICSGY